MAKHEVVYERLSTTNPETGENHVAGDVFDEKDMQPEVFERFLKVGAVRPLMVKDGSQSQPSPQAADPNVIWPDGGDRDIRPIATNSGSANATVSDYVAGVGRDTIAPGLPRPVAPTDDSTGKSGGSGKTANKS